MSDYMFMLESHLNAEQNRVVAEVQTCCDVTYRLYDWERQRPASDAGLHVEESLAAMDWPEGDSALGPQPRAVDAVRRHHPRHGDDESDARVAAAWRASVLAVGAAEVRVVSLPVPAVGHLPSRAAARHRAAAETRSAHAWIDLP